MPSERYCRQINLIGEASQLKLAKASILVIGAGGVGSPVLLYLAAGGIGKLGFIDHDIIHLSNLHRQILYTEQDIGGFKSSAAYVKLKALNSEIGLVEYNAELSLENARSIFSNYDLIIDGSDNFKTRYLVNDICCQLNKPFISASVFKKNLQIIFFDIKNGCYRCIFPEPPPPFLMNNCSDAGVLGTTTGMAGCITASLAIKYVSKPEEVKVQKIISFNDDNFETRYFPFSQKNDCAACQKKCISWPAAHFNVERQHIDISRYSIIDIREYNEERKTRLANDELHIPFTEILEPSDLIPKRKLLLYCQSGLRSDYAAHVLRKKGFQAFSLKGGLKV